MYFSMYSAEELLTFKEAFMTMKIDCENFGWFFFEIRNKRQWQHLLI